MATTPKQPPRLSEALARVLLAATRDGYTLCEDSLSDHGALIAEGQPLISVAAATLRALQDRGLIEQSGVRAFRRHDMEYRVTYAGHMALARYDLDHSGRPTNKRAYGLLLAVSRQVGWPIHFATDLTVHDRGILTHLGAPSVFGWRLGDFGTDLYPVGDAHALLQARASVANNPASHWYWYEGGVLDEVGAAEVVRRLERALAAADSPESERAVDA